ncbi:hypothetical protein GCM10009021_06470 [Halarchaeum nitratireducens]|uniref:Uncharacterized protein n=1 Tax=Halarchaeum nitratireducens TaxID=489913 RepID=A0A830G891_9EURY|nr:hypothetical protein GCM10009021_06470 [Halarchaeum nitratireducens]
MVIPFERESSARAAYSLSAVPLPGVGVVISTCTDPPGLIPLAAATDGASDRYPSRPTDICACRRTSLRGIDGAHPGLRWWTSALDVLAVASLTNGAPGTLTHLFTYTASATEISLSVGRG